jgi:hypothetical protein
MPKKPRDYSLGKIYKIYSVSNPEMEYIGSTTQQLCYRINNHRKDFRKYLKTGKKTPTSSYKLLERYDDCIIELICKYPCNSKKELEDEEGRWIRLSMESGCCVNQRIAGRTPKQWREDNKEKEKERLKKYRENNKEKEKERHKKYRQDNKEKIKDYSKKYRENNKEKIKQYRQDNKEKIKDYSKKYRENNKEKIKEINK